MLKRSRAKAELDNSPDGKCEKILKSDSEKKKK